MNQKVPISSLFGIIVTLVVATGVGGYLYIQSQMPDDTEAISAPLHRNKQASSPIPPQTVSQFTVPTDWKTYRNEKYGFELSYPRNWVAEPGTTGDTVVEINDVIAGKSANGFAYGFVFVTYYDRSENWDLYLQNAKFKNAKYFNFLNNRALSALVTNTLVNYSATEMIVEHDNHIYEIDCSNAGDIETSKKILSTFKFTK